MQVREPKPKWYVVEIGEYDPNGELGVWIKVSPRTYGEDAGAPEQGELLTYAEKEDS